MTYTIYIYIYIFKREWCRGDVHVQCSGVNAAVESRYGGILHNSLRVLTCYETTLNEQLIILSHMFVRERGPLFNVCMARYSQWAALTCHDTVMARRGIVAASYGTPFDSHELQWCLIAMPWGLTVC